MPMTGTSAVTAAADRLAAVRPSGTIAIAGPLLEVLYERIEAAGERDPRIPPAVGEGDAVAAALAAGCPPQFHPGVPADHAAVLHDLRRQLGVDRATQIAIAPDTDARYVRVLRAIGCILTIQSSDLVGDSTATNHQHTAT
ncbi:unannotated protein [freshwater metagenome]|uniref:Unannotated protein n=2 Tax=root TaxID=1 RepID=A0A6J7JDN0_9ZZZZ